MDGHGINVRIHFNVKLPQISGHLPKADTDSHFLVVAITESVNKYCVFGRHFNLKSLALRAIVRSNFRDHQ